jgi:hypothetical protein
MGEKDVVPADETPLAREPCDLAEGTNKASAMAA